ncbi:glycosyltransferase [Microlunatus speluncae]|uniref:glycosyltransferase n=1 Tax=Microlunatus speluncae TaxID=2594267 RepID=UPI0012663F0B|nr:glycosyltransferase [Microlunatus speluncae]
MRVVLTTVGSRGDVEPVIALALRLRELGVDVRMCASPDFAELLDGSGVEFRPLGRPVRSLVAGAKPPSAQDAFKIAADLVAERYEVLSAAARDCDVLVATGLMPAGAREAAEKLGIRYVFACLQPQGLPAPTGPVPGESATQAEIDDREQWDRDAVQRADALYRGPLNQQRALLDLPPVDHVRDHIFTDRPWLAADPVLAPWPQNGNAVVRTGAWIRPDRRPLPDDLVTFLDAGDPPVYVGFGSMGLHTATDVARVAIEAVRGVGRRVVLASGWADLALIDDRDDCFVVGEVNQQELFRRVAAVVHHGGAGTTTTTARAGAPQVVVAQIGDQPYWARRVAELGIGVAHAGTTPTVESLTAALTTALTGEVRARATAVAGTIRTDGTTVAADLLHQHREAS